VEVIGKLGGEWPDGELAVTMNRMRCKPADGKSWTTVRVRELRERLGIAPFDPTTTKAETITVHETVRRLKICVGSVDRLIRDGVLPATQLMPSAPWRIPVAALTSKPIKQDVQAVVNRRPRKTTRLQDDKMLKLPGL
jgi:hypothetical protein